MLLREKTYELPDAALHVMEAGPVAGKVMLFLHGFPEFWYTWRKQLEYFAGLGYRAVAPDQRGYNLSSKPAGVNAYTLEILAADIAGLIKQLGEEKVVLVGHDWGGAVAWAVADKYPELLEKLVILNMPHPQELRYALKHYPRQMLRSSYAIFFQLPLLPELVQRAFNFKVLERSLTLTSRQGTFSPEDLAQFKIAWGQPGALTAMLNWYRATRISHFRFRPLIDVPTLIIWGKLDKFLGQEMALPSMERCANGQLIYLKDASHWLHHEEPERVNSLITNFLNAG